MVAVKKQLGFLECCQEFNRANAANNLRAMKTIYEDFKERFSHRNTATAIIKKMEEMIKNY